MSEIKRYSVADILCLDEQIDLCKYKDVEPIIQRNKELESELARLREQEPVCHVSGFDRVWWNDKFTSPDEVPKRNTPLYAEPKPAAAPECEVTK
jgi:hypothetical protein